MNHFERLGLTPAFDIDLKALEQGYFRLQRQTHPDMLATRPEAERLAAAQEAMSANEAYQTLKSPLTRAEYLLKLQGQDVNAEQGGVKPAQALLMQMMEAREELARCVEAAEVDALLAQNQKAIARSVEKLSALFAQKKWDDAAQETIHLKYLHKFAEEARIKKKASHGTLANS